MMLDHARPITRRQERVRNLLIALFVGVNVAIIPATITFGPHKADWQTFMALREVVGTDEIYSLDTLIPFVWSPAAAWLMATVTYLGYWPWLALHIVSLALLRAQPILALLMVGSWAFWVDVAQGNILTFIVIAGVLAMQGSRWAALLSVALFILMPRPVQLPLVAFLLWKQPGIRWASAGIFLAHAAYVVVGGFAIPWLTAVMAWGGEAVGVGPTRLVGLAWLIIGLPLGAWLTWRGLVGWAGLAVSPYVLPQYLIMPVTDLAKSPWAGRHSAPDDK